MTWILVCAAAAGIAGAVAGIVGIFRDGRRMSVLVYAIVGLATAMFAIGFLLFIQGHQGMLFVLGVTALIVLVLGNLVGYPLLTVFFLWSGLTVLRKETRTLGNALALLAGVALILLPVTLDLLAPPDTVRDDAGYITRYAAHLAVVLIVAYIAFAFAAFIGASLLYRWRRSPVAPEAIIVLGAGLIDGEVSPLLAGRLERGLEAQRAHAGAPTIIASGGQGPDEPRPEGTAMRDFLIDHGADPDRVVAETESASTSENLRFSRTLLSDPHSRVLVVTSSYHVFRAALLTRSLGMRAHVIGARTRWYFIPSAVLREFLAVMRDRLRLHAICLSLLVAFAVLFSIVLVPAMVPPPGS